MSKALEGVLLLHLFFRTRFTTDIKNQTNKKEIQNFPSTISNSKDVLSTKQNREHQKYF